METRDTNRSIEQMCNLLYSTKNSSNFTQTEIKEMQTFRSRLGFSNVQISKQKWLATVPLQASLKSLGETFASNFQSDTLPDDLSLLTIANIWLEAPTCTSPGTWRRLVDKLDTMKSNLTLQESEALSNIYKKIVRLYEKDDQRFAGVVSKILLLDRDCYSHFVREHLVSNVASKPLATVCLESPELYRRICDNTDNSHVAEFIQSVRRQGSVAPLYPASQQHIICMCEVDTEHFCDELKIRHYRNLINQLLQLYPAHVDSAVRLLFHFPAVFQFVCDHAEVLPGAGRLALLLFSCHAEDNEINQNN